MDGWMDGGIRIIWSRYLLRLFAKKKENHPEPAKLPEAENPFNQKSSTEGTFLLQRPRAVGLWPLLLTETFYRVTKNLLKVLV